MRELLVLGGGIPRVRLLRSFVGAIACFVLPAASWLQGSGTFAWTMYSRAAEFRIELVVTDVGGHRRSRNPTALAERATPEMASLLGGSDHWRQGPSVEALRSHLDDLAEVACRETGSADVELTLHERTLGGSDRSTASRRVCTR